MTEISGQSFVGGSWVSPEGQTFTSVNPRNGETKNLFNSCGSQEINEALTKADEAFQVVRNFNGEKLAEFLNAIADEIEALGDVLLETGDMESGLGIPRMTGERGRTCGQIRAFAAIAKEGQWTQPSIDTAIPDREPIPKPDLRRMMKPIGPVAVFGASNFPFAFGSLGGDTASALAAGNPVIVKGHPSHPATSELFTQAVETAAKKTGMPNGIFSMLQGVGIELGSELVKHPSVKAVGFTGSYRGGRALMDLAASRPEPIPVYAEMGSVNPVFIGKNSLSKNVDALAAGLSGSVCLGTGQFCTSPGVVVTLQSSELEDKMKSAMTEAARGSMLNAGIAQAYSAGLKRLQNTSSVEWLNPVDIVDGEMAPPNAVFKVSASDFLEDKNLAEEVFGPLTLLVVCESEAEMKQVAQSIDGNLTATIHSDGDDELTVELTNILEQKVGRVIYNGYPTGVEVAPSMQHGGPFPASSVSWATSVGADAIVRFARFVAYQNIPDTILPDALKNSNPLGLVRRVNGELTQDEIG